MKLRDRVASLVLATALATLPWVASAASYSESVNGDMSGNRLAPSSLTLDFGSNSISGSTLAGDIDYLTIHVPGFGALWSLTLTSFGSTDDLAFMAIQSGTQFTEPAGVPNVANLLGWAHFSLPVGQDFLEIMGTGPGAIGFSGALPAGDYTLWIQQTGPQLVTYSFDALVSVPEPGSLALVALALAALGAARYGLRVVSTLAANAWMYCANSGSSPFTSSGSCARNASRPSHSRM